MAIGPRDRSSLVLMTGWDATALANWQLIDGTTIAQVQAEMNMALGALNTELTSGLWGRLISFQDRPDVEYNMGTSGSMELHTEYSRPDSQRATTEGHMLPYQRYDLGLGWTYDYLEEARMDQVQADLALGIQAARDRWRVSILTRLFQRGDDSGANKGLGTGGLSPGFATTAGSTGVDYTPPSYGGQTFASTHEHYVGIAGGAFTNGVFTTARTALREHGHQPPYDFIAGISDEATISGLTDFVPVAKTNVNYATTATLATISADPISDGVYPIGVIDDFVVWIVPGVPQYYGFGWKSYGQLSSRNPLRIRTRKGTSRPMVTAYNDPRNGSPTHPLQYMMLDFRFGVGVGPDRTNGTSRYVNNATWADGTPT